MAHVQVQARMAGSAYFAFMLGIPLAGHSQSVINDLFASYRQARATSVSDALMTTAIDFASSQNIYST
jgi:predicted outer membrane lipoprotein